MDDDRPLFITFKPFGEDNTARAKPAPNTTPIQPPGAEQSPGHHNRRGRVGQGDVRADTSPAHHPSAPTLSGAVSSQAALGAPCREQNIPGARPHLSPQRCPFPPGPSRLLVTSASPVPA